MEDKRTELQKKFEEQTPTIKGAGRVKYLQTFVSWLHLQVERCEGQKLPIPAVVGGSEQLVCPDCKQPFTKEEIEVKEHCFNCGWEFAK